MQYFLFVARFKQNAFIGVYKQRPGRKPPGIKKDCTVHLGNIPKPLRVIEYVNPETGNEYSFVTNVFHIFSKTVADLYKKQWKIGNLLRLVESVPESISSYCKEQARLNVSNA